MPQMPIGEVQPGMVLEEPAVDSLGRVLLEAGETLTERYISKLQAFGVGWLSIKPDEPPPSEGDALPKMSAKEQKEILKTLETKFAYVADDVRMKTLYEVVRPYLIGEKE
ncbi:MAG: hypothetical protein E3J72_06340 [Planctomycetota bacterium]|nr:MAG: hypothetical protein E3J72_06340 [Planctomycetota bacterium]